MTSNLIGSPLRDGQDDPPLTCAVCGATDQVTVDRVERSRLKPVDGRHAGTSRLVCLGCLERALKSLGPSVATLNILRCTSCGDAVAAKWPVGSFVPGPYWLACQRHINDALDALIAAREGT